MTIMKAVRRPTGRVALFESLPVCGSWRRGKLIYECDNLFVNAGLPALANLMAGVTAGAYALAVGYGSGSTAPTLTDTDLGATPKYYNAVGSHAFPSPGAVLFNYEIATTDYGANPLTVQELGLFANSATIALPSAVGTANSSWAASFGYSLGNLIVDSNGNIQRVTTAGTSGTPTHPAWATTIGTTTTDNTVTWTLITLALIPSPMLARAVVPSFAFTGTSAYQGSWTFTF